MKQCVSALATLNWAFNQGGPVLSFLTDHHWSEDVQYLQVQWPSLASYIFAMQNHQSGTANPLL